MLKMNLCSMAFGIVGLCIINSAFRYVVDKKSETTIKKAEIKAGAENKPKVEIIEEEKK